MAEVYLSAPADSLASSKTRLVGEEVKEQVCYMMEDSWLTVVCPAALFMLLCLVTVSLRN